MSSVSQSSLSGKFWVYKKVMLLPLLLLLGLFFLKVKLFLASVSSSRMVTCLLLVSFSIWRSVWFYFLFPVCVRVCVCVCVRPLPVHTTSLALFILSLIFYAFNSPPFTFLSFLVFFFLPSLFILHPPLLHLCDVSSCVTIVYPASVTMAMVLTVMMCVTCCYGDIPNPIPPAVFIQWKVSINDKLISVWFCVFIQSSEQMKGKWNWEEKDTRWEMHMLDQG